MISYHACWDLVYLCRYRWLWYESAAAHLWQQSICWTFILLSGYCWSLSRRPLRRGLTTFLGGALVSAVTLAVLPENPIRFGILTFLGTAALLTIPLHRCLAHLPPRAELALSAVLFFLTRNVNRGALGFGSLSLCRLPAAWYQNLLTAALGFPPAGFVSSDYFPLFPWIFLFWAGHALHQLSPDPLMREVRLPLVTAIGRHSLILYLLHQPVLFLVLVVLPSLF